MSYAQTVLQPDEKIIMIGKLHWVVYVQAILWLVCGIVIAALEYAYWGDEFRDMVVYWTLVFFAAVSLLSFLYAWFIRWITEFAVTDRRVIYKRGFIMRHTAEMNMDKVESVDVYQSIPGRMLGYGTIHVKGTGQGIEHLHRIASPMALRNVIIAK